MHHSLHLYGKHQHRLIHLYISLAGWSRIPGVVPCKRLLKGLLARCPGGRSLEAVSDGGPR